MSENSDIKLSGPATGVRGALPDEELQLQQVRLIPNDETEVESRSQVCLQRVFEFPHANRLDRMSPIFAANMFGVGTIPMAKALEKENMLVALDKHLDVESVVTFLQEHEGRTAIPSVGFGEEDEKRAKQIFEQTGRNAPSMIVIDVPNGHMKKMVDTVRHYRKEFPGIALVAGNVATGSMAKKLVEAGADIIKVGIGPGSACTTKLVAGTHRPQFSAVRDVAQNVHDMGAYVIADGGVRTAGDVAVALAAGADFVMIGGAFAAHNESGEPIYKDENGNEFQEFMGSSSAAYMKRTKGDVAHYRAAEGELQWIPHKGSILQPGAILSEIKGGVRSAASYVGAASLADLSKMARATYRGNEGGLKMVKAEMGINGSGGAAKPSKIISGRENPITGQEPREDLIPNAS